MHSRSELWVYFPLQELLASDADMRAVRLHMRVSISNYYSARVQHISLVRNDYVSWPAHL